MSKEYYMYFINTWIETYKNQYKEATQKGKRTLKENIYKNIHLSEREKDNIWTRIAKN